MRAWADFSIGIHLSLMVLFTVQESAAQTFCSGCPLSTSIPDNSCPSYTTSTITVSGVGTIDNTYGLEQVCVYITHTWRSDLDIYLVAPDGTRVELSTDNGSSGDNYGTGCSTNQMLCFDVTAGTSITTWTSTDPADGTYQPEGCMGAVNNGQNANGTWTLEVCDDLGGDVGAIQGWCLIFGPNPAPPPSSLPADFSMTAPFTHSGTTCGAGNDVVNNSCNTSYDGGEDVIYAINFPSAGTYQITLTNTDGSGWIGWFLTNSPPGGCGGSGGSISSCIASATSGSGNTAQACVTITTPGTYYLIVDYFPSPTCSNYDISVTSVSGGFSFSCQNPPNNDNFPNCQCIVPSSSNLTGSTTGYTADQPANLSSEFCGSIENNQWFCFQAPSSSVTFDFIVSNCTWGDGIQAHVYEYNGCGFTGVSNCWNPATQTNGSVTASGLVPGQVYVLMVDGWAGDECDFEIVGWAPGTILSQSNLRLWVEPNEALKVHILRWEYDGGQDNAPIAYLILRKLGEDPWEPIARFSSENGSACTNGRACEKHVKIEEGAIVTFYQVAGILPSGDTIFSQTVSVTNPTGIDISFSNGNIILFSPVPRFARVEIYSLEGRKVLEETVYLNGVSPSVVPSHNLLPGAYLVRVTESITSRITIRRLLVKEQDWGVTSCNPEPQNDAMLTRGLSREHLVDLSR